MDFAFALGDDTQDETPPAWEHEMTGYWRHADPDRAGDDPAERRLALIRTRKELERRLRLFMNLPTPSLDRMSLRSAAR